MKYKNLKGNATPNQLSLIQKFGVSLPEEGLTKQEASDLIAHCIEQKKQKSLEARSFFQRKPEIVSIRQGRIGGLYTPGPFEPDRCCDVVEDFLGTPHTYNIFGRLVGVELPNFGYVDVDDEEF